MLSQRIRKGYLNYKTLGTIEISRWYDKLVCAGNSLVPVSAVAVLMQAYQEEKHWPEIFVRVYMDDAIGIFYF